jgi:hypothetical protein
MTKTFFHELLGLTPAKSKLKEDGFPRDAMGKPDLSCYTESLDYYIQMHQQYLASLDNSELSPKERNLAWSRRAHGQWGLIAKRSDAIDYALSLLRGKQPEAREDGAAILAAVSRDESVLDNLIVALKQETDITAKDTIVGALGKLKSRRAVPALVAIIRNTQEDFDSRLVAVESLSEIVGKRFHEQNNPIQAVNDWFEKQSEIGN